MEEQIENKQKSTSKYYCYILFQTKMESDLTYNGSTNNLVRRLRQHNGEIVGGAKATSGKGPWKYLTVIEGFIDHHDALCCEWRIKHPTGKKRPKKYCGKKGRIESLNFVLNLDNWTSKSTGLETGNEYTVYILDELVNLIDKTKIKPNVTIKSIGELIY
jgi:predicted GIY-YIG superfamily endonuclease